MEVMLTDGSKMLCDREDYLRFCIEMNFRTMSVGNHGYVRFFDGTKSQMFHRWVLGYPTLDVGHKDANKRNNQKSNLEIITKSQNFCNLNDPLYVNNTSGVRGVNYHAVDNTWCARIQMDNQRIILGYFKNKEDAIAARKQAELDLGFLQPIGKQI